MFGMTTVRPFDKAQGEGIESCRGALRAPVFATDSDDRVGGTTGERSAPPTIPKIHSDPD